MKKSYIKLFTMILTVFTVLTIFGSFTLGSENVEQNVDLGGVESVENQQAVSNGNEDNTNETIENADLNDASENILNNVTKNERKKAYYIDKYNDEFLGTVAYILDIVRIYSLPICFIGLTIGSFNFLIMGNKKLDKKEQGFGWIVGFTIGLVVFNVLPLLYALLVIKR